MHFIAYVQQMTEFSLSQWQSVDIYDIYIVVFLPKNINNLSDFIINKYTKHIESIDKTTWTYVCRYYHNNTITSHTDIGTTTFLLII